MKSYYRQVREHVFSDASQKADYDHSRWGQKGEVRQQQQQDQQLRQVLKQAVHNPGDNMKGIDSHRGWGWVKV